jgi:chemotaxis family two-component system response regulator Rcp1
VINTVFIQREAGLPGQSPVRFPATDPHGTTLRLLPDESEPKQASPLPAAPGAQSVPVSKVIALLAEDNRADALLIEDAIAAYNLPIELHIVEDGEEAFAFIQRVEADEATACPQMVLLDLNLPRRSGKEVLHFLRGSRRCKDIPVLVVSSSDMSKDRTDVGQLGADYYFRKPSNYDEFLKVGEVLKTIIERVAGSEAGGK